MKLIKLTLKNFMGIRDFTLDIGGNNASVYADNAVGKTTLYSAFLWLLFNKDSQGKSDFAIKTLDAQGNAIPMLDHEVEGVFEINGTILSLKKVYAEKWTKKRGQAKAEFTGHSTDYFIDDVPAKKSEYDSKIASICNEDVFKLLTNPAYFNEQLHWQKRREILLEVCGDLSDAEVIASDQALFGLPKILNGRALEDHRKVIAAKRAAINKEMQSIPVRIDEVHLSLPDVSSIDLAETEAKLADLRKRSKAKEQQVIRIESGGEVAEKNKQLTENGAKIMAIRNEYHEKYTALLNEAQEDMRICMASLLPLKAEVDALDKALVSNNQEVARINASMGQLRESWHQVNGEALECEPGNTCPTCGQFLPAEQVEQARQKALAAFNHNKATKLENINATGKTAKAKADALTKENAEIAMRIDERKKSIQDLHQEQGALDNRINSLKAELEKWTKDPAYIKAIEQRDKLNAEIDELKQGRGGEVARVNAEIDALAADIRHLEAQQDAHKRHQQGQVRIEELKAQEKALAAEYEQLESELYLTEEFIRAKVKLLEEKINSRFKLARFKLFDTQINGGLVETCQTTFGGVPYDSGLNNGARINIGLDIINTLSDHYGFTAPIFADNAEAVTRLIDTKGQLIRLVVSEADKKLRIEVGKS